MQKQLPRLNDLGVDILWLMPIHPISEKNRKGTLGSYYAVKDYKAVNPEFGTLQDFKDFVNEAHNLGMKVIIDEVCNHTGCDNIWVTEHPEYYQRNEQGEMFGPMDWTDTYQLDYSNPGLRNAMKDALKFWVAEADIDGYRCDVAGMVPTDFWEEVRPELEAIKPIFMLAEASEPELEMSAFDSDYNWPMKDVFNAIAANHGVNKYAVDNNQTLPALNANAIPELINLQARQYPQGSTHMNMVTNHDLNTWEGTEFQRYGKGLGAFAVLSFTLPGIPMMYTGQEVGFDHPFEFFEYDTVPDYTANEHTAFYEMLNALKASNSALNAGRNGGSFSVIPTDNDNVLAFERTGKDGDRVIVIANLSNENQPLNFSESLPNLDGLKNYFYNLEPALPQTLTPWQYIIFAN